MDRYGQWLACVCLDGALYLLPVVSLVLVRKFHAEIM